MLTFGMEERASFYRKEFNTESAENAENTEKRKQDRLKPVPYKNG
jgi:hypothetical protein